MVVIHTDLSAESFEPFKEECQRTGKSRYKLAREIIEAHYKQKRIEERNQPAARAADKRVTMDSLREDLRRRSND